MDTLVSVGQRPIRLLSLDGGGIRGLSSIIILKEIMRQVNRGVPAAEHLQPWQVFDLIGGTSTGGIIAVMLGRLRMSLKECEEAYLKLGKDIFEPKRGKWDGRRLMDFVQANEKFDSSILESSIRTIIGEKTGDENTPLKPFDTPTDGDCKVFVCSVLEANSEPVFLRTYESGSLADPLSDDFALWQALRATSAASTFFDAYQHGVKKFVDGGFAYNNPVQRVMIEAADLWGADRPSLLISIGTGESMGQSLGGNLKGLAECMVRLVTQTERTADDFYSSHTTMVDNNMYFRFNVTGLANIGMQEYKEVPAIDSHTIAYLTKGTTARGLSAVVRMIRNIQITDGANSTGISVKDLKKEDKECIQALYLRAGDYKSHIEQLDQPVKGTCGWIFEHPKFLKFRDSKDASFLWVTGNAGCGKSILARFLTDHLGSVAGTEEKTAPAPIVCSFFFKVGQDRRTESQSAVSALLHQLFLARPILSLCGRAEYAAKSSDFTQSPEAVWKIICEACSRIPQREVICIVDALDECSEFSRKRFIEMMLSTFMVPSAKKTAGFLKVLVTSRPWLEIEEQFGPDSSIRLRGEDETNALNNDIGMVVEHRIKDFKTRGILSTMTGEVVKRILNEKADGTFLWISLVLESIISLKSYAPSAIKNRLIGIPKDLDALYARALPEFDDNTDAEKSRKLLSILLAATRPLELGEIGICLSLSSTTTKLCHMEEEPNIDRAVKGFGGFFIRIANKKVSLVHQTAREYLLRNNGATPGKFWKHSISNFESNLTLAWSCLQFLLLQDWVEYLETLENADPMNYGAHLSNVFLASQGSFYHYAAVNWLRHVEAASVNHESPPELRNIITKLCDQSKVPFATWWSFFKSRQGYWGSSSLHWAAEEGNLVFLQESFRANPLQITAEISRILEAAAKGNQCRVLDWISLKFGTRQLDTKPALIQAIRNGEVSVVEQIIKINVFDLNGEYLGVTPLDVAVEEGDMTIIHVLVDRGADPCDEKAFRRAILASRQDIMSFLLETIGGDTPHKRAKLLLRGLETIVTEKMVTLLRRRLETTVTENVVFEMFKSIMDQGLALPRPYKEPFKLADAAYRHDASSVLQLIGDNIPDERGIALILGSHEPEVLSPLLAVGNYETKQIWEAFRYLDCGTARLYRKLLAPRLSGSDRNFDFTTKRSPLLATKRSPLLATNISPLLATKRSPLLATNISPLLATNTSPKKRKRSLLLATNTSPKKRDGCLQLFLRKLTGLNRHFSNNAITDLLSCDGDMEQLIPIPTLIAMLDKTVPETAASFFTLAFVCGAGQVIHHTSSCIKVNLKDRHGMTPLLAAVLARSDGLSRYLLKHGANPGIISWYTAGVDEPTVEGSIVSKESSEFPVIDQEGGSGGLSLSMLGDMLVSTGQTWESIWDILGRDTFVESPLSLGYKDGVKPFASEVDARLFREYDDNSPAPFQILLEDQPTEVAQYSLGFLQYKRLCEGSDVDMLPLLTHSEEPSLAFFNDVPTKLILPTPYAPKLNLSGCTALHLAAKHGLDSLILELLHREQSPTAVDQDGKTPLHLYVGANIVTIETMLCSGANLAAIDNMGRTPLHEAVIYQKRRSSGVKRLVECLIEAGAAPLARDASGLTPLHYSIQTAKTIQSTEIMEVLVKGMIRTGGLLTTRYDDGLTVLEFAENIRQQAIGSDEDIKVMDNVVATLNKVETWGYSGLDQDEICGFYESMKAWDPSRADPCELDWLSEDDIDEAELA